MSDLNKPFLKALFSRRHYWQLKFYDMHSFISLVSFSRGNFLEFPGLVKISLCEILCILIDSEKIFKKQLTRHHYKKNQQRTLFQCIYVYIPTVFQPRIPCLLMHVWNDLQVSTSNSLFNKSRYKQIKTDQKNWEAE